MRRLPVTMSAIEVYVLRLLDLRRIPASNANVSWRQDILQSSVHADIAPRIVLSHLRM